MPEKVTADELRKKLEELLRRAATVEADKKTANTSYNEELKEIKDEVKKTLAEIDEIKG